MSKRTLQFIRHAKSCWGNPLLLDQNRPISPRGKKDCQRMAVHLFEHAVFDKSSIFSSTATRAQQTIHTFNDTLVDKGHSALSWRVDEALYTFSEQNLMDWISIQDSSVTQLIIIGHNPALCELINLLVAWDEQISHLPTCGYAKIECAGAGWDQISANQAKLVQFTPPKTLR